MTTIVNTPAPAETSGSGLSMVVGLLVLLAFLFVFFVYGLPAIRQIGSPQINLPSKIDVNINQSGK